MPIEIDFVSLNHIDLITTWISPFLPCSGYFCPKAFSQKSDLDRHTRRIHSAEVKTDPTVFVDYQDDSPGQHHEFHSPHHQQQPSRSQSQQQHSLTPQSQHHQPSPSPHPTSFSPHPQQSVTPHPQQSLTPHTQQVLTPISQQALSRT
jgi:hypothetical protein